MSAAIYKWESLRPGNKIPGCAVLESMHSTYFVPPGWQVEIDRHGNARAEHMEGKNNPSDPAQPTKSYAKQT